MCLECKKKKKNSTTRTLIILLPRRACFCVLRRRGLRQVGARREGRVGHRLYPGNVLLHDLRLRRRGGQGAEQVGMSSPVPRHGHAPSEHLFPGP